VCEATEFYGDLKRSPGTAEGVEYKASFGTGGQNSMANQCGSKRRSVLVSRMRGSIRHHIKSTILGLRNIVVIVGSAILASLDEVKEMFVRLSQSIPLRSWR
jgi:hypothetical protein